MYFEWIIALIIAFSPNKLTDFLFEHDLFISKV